MREHKAVETASKWCYGETERDQPVQNREGLLVGNYRDQEWAFGHRGRDGEEGSPMATSGLQPSLMGAVRFGTMLQGTDDRW